MNQGQRSILIVDDEAQIRNNLALLLEDDGFVVFTAQDGNDALRVLREGRRPDLIVLDLMMPSMNGWEFRGHQLADPALAKIPVIILSGVPSIRTEAATLRADDFAAKPIAPSKLLAMIARHVPAPKDA